VAWKRAACLRRHRQGYEAAAISARHFLKRMTSRANPTGTFALVPRRCRRGQGACHRPPARSPTAAAIASAFAPRCRLGCRSHRVICGAAEGEVFGAASLRALQIAARDDWNGVDQLMTRPPGSRHIQQPPDAGDLCPFSRCGSSLFLPLASCCFSYRRCCAPKTDAQGSGRFLGDLGRPSVVARPPMPPVNYRTTSPAERSTRCAH